MFLSVLISVNFKQLVILGLFFLIEADLGWAELLLEHEYLSRESFGWHRYIKCLSCIPKSRWRWICPLSYLSFYACVSLAASKCVKIHWERRNETDFYPQAVVACHRSRFEKIFAFNMGVSICCWLSWLLEVLFLWGKLPDLVLQSV